MQLQAHTYGGHFCVADRRPIRINGLCTSASVLLNPLNAALHLEAGGARGNILYTAAWWTSGVRLACRVGHSYNT